MSGVRVAWILLALLIALTGCGGFSSLTVPASEASDDCHECWRQELSITLNREPLGTTADPTALRRRIASIMEFRKANGVYIVGTNDLENTVFVAVDRAVPTGVWADLITAINENDGKSYVAVKQSPFRSDDYPRHPNPLTLVVEGGAADTGYDLLYSLGRDRARQYALAPRVTIVDQPEVVAEARASGASLEIASDGGYFINVPRSAGGTGSDAVQRKVDWVSMGAEVVSLTSQSGKVSIIVSERAVVDSLYTLFENAPSPGNVEWNILVRRVPAKDH